MALPLPKIVNQVDAKEIADFVLRETGEAIMNNDFQRFADCFDFPQTLDTFDGPVLLETPDDLRSVFYAVQKNMRHLGVTAQIRTCLAAEYRPDGTIHTTHESRLLASTSLVETYACYSLLAKRNGTWKITYTSYAMGDTNQYLGDLNDLPTGQS